MNNVKALRLAAGLRQADVRGHIGMGKALYSKMENGIVYPNSEDRDKLAEVLDAPAQAVATYAEDAQAAKAASRPGDRHKVKRRVSFRPRKPEEFFRALEVLDMTPTEWLRRQEANAIRAAKRKARTGEATPRTGTQKNTASTEYHGKEGLSNGWGDAGQNSGAGAGR